MFLDSVFTVLIATLFALSGLVANILWAASLPFWWLERKDVYRKCASIISEAWYRVVLFIPLNWAGCEMEIYSTDDVEKYCGNESAICVANHRYTVDWIIAWAAADHYGMLGQCKAFIKAVVAKFPVIGWSMWFNEYCFLSREKNKDISVIKKSTEHLKEYTNPCWLLLYPEGTRFNAAKHAESMKFAEENNLPKLRYHLLPRPKGFNELVTNLKGSNVKAIYDCTFQMEDDFDVPISNWLKRKPTKIRMAATRIDLNTIPTDPAESKKFLYNLFQEKDQLFHEMLENPKSTEFCLKESRFYSKPMKLHKKDVQTKPLLTAIFWSFMILWPLSKYIISCFMSSFKGSLVTSAVLIGLNFGVSYLLELFHKKPSSYGLKKTS